MYSYENYSKVKESIEKRRLEAIKIADEKTMRLHIESEELRKIDKELSGTGLLLFKTACEGGDINAVRQRNQELVRARGELLVSLGYTADYTDVKYFCQDPDEVVSSSESQNAIVMIRAKILGKRSGESRQVK